MVQNELGASSLRRKSKQFYSSILRRCRYLFCVLIQSTRKKNDSARTFQHLFPSMDPVAHFLKIKCHIYAINEVFTCRWDAKIISHLHRSRAHQNAFFTVPWITPRPVKKRNSRRCKLVISHTSTLRLCRYSRLLSQPHGRWIKMRETCPFNNRRRHSLNPRIPKLSAYMESFTVWCAQMKWVPISECSLGWLYLVFGERCESQQQKPPRELSLWSGERNPCRRTAILTQRIN